MYQSIMIQNEMLPLKWTSSVDLSISMGAILFYEYD